MTDLHRPAWLLPAVFDWWRVRGRSALLVDGSILLLVAIAFSWGRAICSQEPSEDLVLVINSLTRSTFYYPGSNRILNIVGFAAGWIDDVHANYHFQLFLRMMFAVTWPYLAFRLVLQPRHCLVATLLFHAIVLAQFNDAAVHVAYGSVHPYSTSWFFLMLALLCAREFSRAAPGRRNFWAAGAFVLALLASAVAQTNMVYVLLVFGVYGMLHLLREMRVGHRLSSFDRSRSLAAIRRIVAEGSWQKSAVIAGLFALALVLAALHGSYYARAYPESVRSFSSTSYTGLKLSLAGVKKAATNLWEASGQFALLLELTAVLLIAGFHQSWRRSRGYPRTTLENAWPVAAIASGFLYLLVISQLGHMKVNAYNFRYFLIISQCVVFVFVLKAFEVVHLLAPRTAPRWIRKRPLYRAIVAGGAAISLALLSGFSSFGTPTIYCPFVAASQIHSRAGQLAAKEGYVAILGSYWDLWPVVFHAWKGTAKQPVATRVFPTGYRAETFVPEIRAEATRRLLSDGSIKMLCVGRNRQNSEFGPIDCTKIASWNVAWGILPQIGTIAEVKHGNDSSLADVTMTLPNVKIGEGVDFSVAGRPDILLSGWYNPEAFGTWTNGTDARIAFVLNCDEPIDLVLQFRMETWVGAFVRDPEPLSIDVLWNGQKIFDWVYTKDQASLFQVGTVPKGSVRCNLANIVHLRIGDPRMLRDLGNRQDKGVAVQSMSLTRAGNPR